MNLFPYSELDLQNIHNLEILLTVNKTKIPVKSNYNGKNNGKK